MSVVTVLGSGQPRAVGAELTSINSEASVSSLTQFARVRLLQFGVAAQDADDLAQDVMLNMMRQLPSFETERGSLESWITGFAKMAAKAWMRQRMRRIQREVPLEMAPGVIDDATNQHALVGALDGALSRLPEGDQAIVTMRFTQGLSSKQIADRLGMSDAAVRKRLSRAIERVRRDGILRDALFL